MNQQHIDSQYQNSMNSGRAKYFIFVDVGEEVLLHELWNSMFKWFVAMWSKYGYSVVKHGETCRYGRDALHGHLEAAMIGSHPVG